MDLIDRIEALFARHGHALLDAPAWEQVTLQQHALQCAQLAEWAHAGPDLVAAALLHDLGHIVDEDAAAATEGDDVHELRALPLLRRGFAPGVLEPIRLHVQAKRYLAAIDPRYVPQLHRRAVHSLRLQGGPMSVDEVQAFELLPHAVEAVALRRWDDAARDPTRRSPPMAYYLPLLRQLQAGHAPAPDLIRLAADDRAPPCPDCAGCGLGPRVVGGPEPESMS